MPIMLGQLFLVAISSYLWGSVPAGYWMGKLLRGKDFDIRVKMSTSSEPPQAFGDPACHPERSEGSRRPASQILRFAQDDSASLRMTGILSNRI